MPTTTPRTRFLRMAAAACASLILVVAGGVPPAHGDGRPARNSSPGALYLSLGDSMAFGLQFDRLFEMLDAGTYTPDAFDTGYSDVFAERMQQLRVHQQTTNLACPGETASTMVGGGCFFTAPEPDGPGLRLHASYDGPQLDAAVTFLETHAEVSPITISIGGADVASVISEQCNFDETCVAQSGVRDELGHHLDLILNALQKAEPRAQIMLVAFYNPFTLDVPRSDGLWRRYYTQVQKRAAARNGVLIADVSDLLDQHDVCDVTFLCSSGDFHPTDLGYELISQRMIQVAGYQQAPSSDHN